MRDAREKCWVPVNKVLLPEDMPANERVRGGHRKMIWGSKKSEEVAQERGTYMCTHFVQKLIIDFHGRSQRNAFRRVGTTSLTQYPLRGA